MTGAIDLPRPTHLLHLKAVVETMAFETDFAAIHLVPGRYATLQASLLEQPNDAYSPERAHPFSGSGYLEAATLGFCGYEFAITPGEVVYFGTTMLALERRVNWEWPFATLRIVDEWSLAVEFIPGLAGKPSTGLARLITSAHKAGHPPPTGAPVPRIG